ncbi:MAG: hypothetical protein ACM3JD_11235 [Rudaea sp.]
MNWKTGTALAVVAFGVTLAYYVSSRLSTDALNMAVGVLCGMAAGVPVSLGLLLAVIRQRGHAGGEDEIEGTDEFRDPHPGSTQARGKAPLPQTPQIIVIAPPQAQYNAGQLPYGYPGGTASYGAYPPSMNEDVIDGREWRIIGDDEG